MTFHRSAPWIEIAITTLAIVKLNKDDYFSRFGYTLPKKILPSLITEKPNSLLKMLTREMETGGKMAKTNGLLHICKIQSFVIKHTIPDG